MHLNSLILIREIGESRPHFHNTKMMASFCEIVSSLKEMKYSAIIIFLNILELSVLLKVVVSEILELGYFVRKKELFLKAKDVFNQLQIRMDIGNCQNIFRDKKYHHK